jgi:catechol 2,3-dioxygenase-like lactoylglutathione lyase family enzyme
MALGLSYVPGPFQPAWADGSELRRPVVGIASCGDGFSDVGLHNSRRQSMDMRLELVPLPTSDVDRSKEFYVDRLGFKLDHDVQPGNGMRVVQMTPPGSACSISVGVGFSDPDAPRVLNLHLVVDDVEAARAHLVSNDIEVSPVSDMGGIKYAFFSDPDGNSWALQQLLR